jgi:hypothetical protein
VLGQQHLLQGPGDLDRRLGAKKEVRRRVMVCRINLGNFVMTSDLYVTILGSYDIMIGMDWLESHDVILNCKTKQLSLTDDEGRYIWFHLRDR